jgi:hypothetical protein
MRDEVLALRVAARFHREAGFIPLKWFKGKSAELKAILKKPLDQKNKSQYRPISYWPDWFQEDVIGFFDRFQKEFNELGTNEEIKKSVATRVEMAKGFLQSVWEKLDKVSSYLSGYANFSDPKEYLTWRAKSAIEDKLQETVKVMGDFLKMYWWVEEGKVDALVQKTLKRATAQETAYLIDEEDYQHKYVFLRRIGFEESAKKALKRARLDWKPDWVDRIYEMLQANYSEQAVTEHGAFREFDLYGIKVVVDDSTVTEEEIKKYIKYLDEAYARMKAKGFAKAWYGTVFILCKECGGPNPYSSRGTGGSFDIRPDTVQIYSRPGHFIVELMAHELGHRYWFKQMTSAQRAKFADLVKTHTVWKPSHVEAEKYTEADLTRIRERILREQEEGKEYLSRVIRADVDPQRKARWRERASDALRGLGETVLNIIKYELEDKSFKGKNFQDLGPEVEGLLDNVYTSKQKLTERCQEVPIREFIELPQEEIDRWASETEQLMDELVANTLIYTSAAIEGANKGVQERIDNDPQLKAWLESYENNPNPVLPVSDYGKSNIDEAFAEVFMKYVMEHPMDRDQLESFKSVLSSTEDPLVDLIVQRYLASGVAPGYGQGPLP